MKRELRLNRMSCSGGNCFKFLLRLGWRRSLSLDIAALMCAKLVWRERDKLLVVSLSSEVYVDVAGMEAAFVWVCLMGNTRYVRTNSTQSPLQRRFFFPFRLPGICHKLIYDFCAWIYCCLSNDTRFNALFIYARTFATWVQITHYVYNTCT